MAADQMNILLNSVTLVGAVLSLWMVLRKIDTLAAKVNDTNARVSKYLRD